MFGRGQGSSEKARRGGGVSVVGAGMVVSGDVATEEELRVDGRIDGNVRCGALDLGEEGAIAGDIEAEEARIAGAVRGKVSARSVVLEAGARVSGDVAYESLAVAAGARVVGRLSHRGDDGAEAAPAGEVARPRAPARSRAAAKAGTVAELFPQAAAE
ncbi:MAG TPA: polymer-forming cytoskeletal protein [Allosphingosinicella sp.]